MKLLLAALLALPLLASPAYCKPKKHRNSISHVKRDVSEKVKQDLFQKAGIPKSRQSGYVIDHIVPLELGGSNNPKNLQVQDKATAHRKDQVENFLRRELQSGRMTLADARKAILHWQTVKIKYPPGKTNLVGFAMVKPTRLVLPGG